MAAYLVTALPLTVLRWIVITVVIYTATTLIHAGRVERRQLRGTGAAQAVRVVT